MNALKDISIEYAHIYTNNQINEEHKLSLDVLKRIQEKNREQNLVASLVVMVDDYSFPDPSFKYDTFFSWLEEYGFKPDYMIRESQLIPLCDEVLFLLRETKTGDAIGEYIRTKKKYPCSLFIATWYLLRLGYLSSSIFDQNLTAKRLINILPVSFKPFEDKALEIIVLAGFSQAPSQIENNYFEGRLIA